jgi:antitoxin YefM
MTVKEQLIREIEEAPEAVLTKFMQIWLVAKQENFAEITADNWTQYQETLFVLQNESLMKQISQSFVTHNQGLGYQPSQGQMDEILSF